MLSLRSQVWGQSLRIILWGCLWTMGRSDLQMAVRPGFQPPSTLGLEPKDLKSSVAQVKKRGQVSPRNELVRSPPRRPESPHGLDGWMQLLHQAKREGEKLERDVEDFRAASAAAQLKVQQAAERAMGARERIRSVFDREDKGLGSRRQAASYPPERSRQSRLPRRSSHQSLSESMGVRPKPLEPELLSVSRDRTPPDYRSSPKRVKPSQSQEEILKPSAGRIQGVGLDGQLNETIAAESYPDSPSVSASVSPSNSVPRAFRDSAPELRPRRQSLNPRTWATSDSTESFRGSLSSEELGARSTSPSPRRAQSPKLLFPSDSSSYSTPSTTARDPQLEFDQALRPRPSALRAPSTVRSRALASVSSSSSSALQTLSPQLAPHLQSQAKPLTPSSTTSQSTSSGRVMTTTHLNLNQLEDPAEMQPPRRIQPISASESSASAGGSRSSSTKSSRQPIQTKVVTLNKATEPPPAFDHAAPQPSFDRAKQYKAVERLWGEVGPGGMLLNEGRNWDSLSFNVHDLWREDGHPRRRDSQEHSVLQMDSAGFPSSRLPPPTPIQQFQTRVASDALEVDYARAEVSDPGDSLEPEQPWHHASDPEVCSAGAMSYPTAHDPGAMDLPDAWVVGGTGTGDKSKITTKYGDLSEVSQKMQELESRLRERLSA